MLRLFSKNRLLFAGYLLILAGGLLMLEYFGKSQAHLILTRFHPNFLDQAMIFFTWMGDGLCMLLLGVLLLFVSMRNGLVILSSFLASSLLVQLLKRFVFHDYKRPVAWFHDLGIEIYQIEGLDYHSSFSFPSGHTTTAFAMFFGVAFLVKNTGVKILFLVLAVLTGFSRIYLSQHFLADTLAGSVIGVFTAIIIFLVFENLQKDWLKKNIITLISKNNV